MKRVVLLLVALAGVLGTMIAGCAEYTAHDRYREMTYRRVIDADELGCKDDWDVIWLQERATHLSPWYQP